MFKGTNNVAAMLVVIMLLAQIGLAQHNVVHVNEHAHIEHSFSKHCNGYHGHDDHAPQEKSHEACDICLLSQSLSLGLLADNAELELFVINSQSPIHSDDQVYSFSPYGLYNPRAPPRFLI